LTPGARIAAAIDILETLAAAAGRRTTSPPAIFARIAISARKTGPRCRANVYAVLRHRAALDWWVERAGRNNIAASPRSR